MPDPNPAPPENRSGTGSTDQPTIVVDVGAIFAAEPTLASPLSDPIPKEIGGFRIDEILGEGSFGRVYRAFDTKLNRPRAIKVPRPDLLLSPSDVQAYLKEAQNVARLNHAHIVPVLHVGEAPGYPIFIVFEFIAGTSLRAKLKSRKPTFRESAQLIAILADALHYAHSRGIVHRDVKPENVLLDDAGKPWVADFGLAIHERDLYRGATTIGTPAYMSPEQASGEGHRVDGRADIYSLGVMLYELLIGRRPFVTENLDELLKLVTTQEPKPPRQWNASIPKELERICLRALSKRATDRYSTAHDLAEDLRLATGSESPGASATIPQSNQSRTLDGEPFLSTHLSTTTRTDVSAPVSADTAQPKIVPKGLRSFDEHDADFFLELLPGPYDRHGLPESLRFWKARIESFDSDVSFPVGLLYGPSGCGKSSLVKSGLLPRLSNSICVVYLEATADQTELSVVRGLRKHFPHVPAEIDLIGALSAIRRGEFFPMGQKLLIVIDQFEQWLHTHRGDKAGELVRALRHCDGKRLQCLVLVRDDFWMAATLFFQALEVEPIPRHNSLAVPLFTLPHARRVLTAFGRAFDALPAGEILAGSPADAFLNMAIADLAEDDKIVCVQLSLFAEMLKGRAPWTPAILRDIGGARGVGVAFLDETFNARTADPLVRKHRMAAIEVLRALLPNSGTEIKGNQRDSESLRAVVGYTNRPAEFTQLLQLLDRDLRLITPTEEEGKDEEVSSPDSSFILPPSSFRFYQLSHDYLVPSLRDWITREDRATPAGRARLLLAERTSLWTEKPINRNLPTLVEHLTIRRHTVASKRSGLERKLLSRAAKVHGTSALLALVGCILLIVGGLILNHRVKQGRDRDQAQSLVRQASTADPTQLLGVIDQLNSDQYRDWARPVLISKLDEALTIDDATTIIPLRLALLESQTDSSQIEPLRVALLTAEPEMFVVIRDLLEKSHKAEILEPLWTTAIDSATPTASRFQAACALATYSPTDKRWEHIASEVVERLVTLPASELVPWRKALEPARTMLNRPVKLLFETSEAGSLSRQSAAETLARYAADNGELIAEALLAADSKTFPTLLATAKNNSVAAIARLQRRLDESPDSRSESDEINSRITTEKARALIALAHLGQPDRLWTNLAFLPERDDPSTQDPQLRTELIHTLIEYGVSRGMLCDRWQATLGAANPDNLSNRSIRQALMLSLGGTFAMKPPDDAEQLVAQLNLLELYESDGDAGVHGAAEWLLRKWGFEALVDQRLERLQEMSHEQNRDRIRGNWYVTSQRQTFVILDDDWFYMGSPEGENGRSKDEVLHKRRLNRRVAIMTSEVTHGQFKAFQKANPEIKEFSISSIVKTDDSPQVSVDWFDAARYCNWLSKIENIPQDQWCYEILGTEIHSKKNYLELTGYRLPSEAEWEYACRAGTNSARLAGTTERWLVEYAWYAKNNQDRTQPVRLLKPNDHGLFGCLGNAAEWCQEAYGRYPIINTTVTIDDVETADEVDKTTTRVLRGGAYVSRASNVRSAYRYSGAPSIRNSVIGFRPARTYR